MTGAAYVGWDGTYSFNVTGRRIPVETLNALNYPEVQLSGLLDFTASGSGLFESPRYDVRLSVGDLYVQATKASARSRRASRSGTRCSPSSSTPPRLVWSSRARVASR